MAFSREKGAEHGLPSYPHSEKGTCSAPPHPLARHETPIFPVDGDPGGDCDGHGDDDDDDDDDDDGDDDGDGFAWQAWQQRERRAQR